MDHQARSVPKVAAMQATPLKSAMIGLALSFMLGLAAMLALSQAVYAQAGAVPAPIGVIKHVSAETAAIGDSARYTITVMFYHKMYNFLEIWKQALVALNLMTPIMV